MTHKTAALIIANPGRFRYSLQVLVAAVRQIDTVVQVDTVPSAFSLHLQDPPALVLLDLDLVEDAAPTALARIRARWPGARCVILIGGDGQGQTAGTAGADAILVKGVLASRFIATVEALLSPAENGPMP
jgi:DNA-binding NarL/FixJ family response regulator